MPHLQEIYERYAGQGMKMVAVNVVPEQDSMLADWHEGNGFTFPVLVGANTQNVFADYGMTAAPLNFLLDSEGKILARYEGYSPGAEKEIEQDIRQALNLGS